MSIRPPPGVVLLRSEADRAAIVLRHSDPCVCPNSARGRTLAECCLFDGAVVVDEVSTRPSGTRAGFGHPKCYASALLDCSQKSSKEHYFSESVLLDRRTKRARGRSPRPDRRRAKTHFGTYTGAAYLCERHNQALSAIDSTGAWLFGGIRNSHANAQDRNPPARFVNGTNFERWLLKVACGSVAAQQELVPERWLRILFGEADFPSDWGLHLHIRAGESLPKQGGILTEFSRDNTGAIVAWETTVGQFRFVLTLGRMVHRASNLGAQRVRHPGLTFRYARGPDYICGFTWPDPSGPQVTIDLRASA